MLNQPHLTVNLNELDITMLPDLTKKEPKCVIGKCNGVGRIDILVRIVMFDGACREGLCNVCFGCYSNAIK